MRRNLLFRPFLHPFFARRTENLYGAQKIVSWHLRPGRVKVERMRYDVMTPSSAHGAQANPLVFHTTLIAASNCLIMEVI